MIERRTMYLTADQRKQIDTQRKFVSEFLDHPECEEPFPIDLASTSYWAEKILSLMFPSEADIKSRNKVLLSESIDSLECDISSIESDLHDVSKRLSDLECTA